MAPFGPLDYKEYTIIQTPKGPINLINPQVVGSEVSGVGEVGFTPRVQRTQ